MAITRFPDLLLVLLTFGPWFHPLPMPLREDQSARLALKRYQLLLISHYRFLDPMSRQGPITGGESRLEDFNLPQFAGVDPDSEDPIFDGTFLIWTEFGGSGLFWPETQLRRFLQDQFGIFLQQKPFHDEVMTRFLDLS